MDLTLILMYFLISSGVRFPFCTKIFSVIMIKNKNFLHNLVRVLKNFRRCESRSCVIVPGVPNIKSNVSKKQPFSGSMRDYFENRGLSHIFEDIPPFYRQRRKNAPCTVLVDPKIASRLCATHSATVTLLTICYNIFCYLQNELPTSYVPD